MIIKTKILTVLTTIRSVFKMQPLSGVATYSRKNAIILIIITHARARKRKRKRERERERERKNALSSNRKALESYRYGIWSQTACSCGNKTKESCGVNSISGDWS